VVLDGFLVQRIQHCHSRSVAKLIGDATQGGLSTSDKMYRRALADEGPRDATADTAAAAVNDRVLALQSCSIWVLLPSEIGRSRGADFDIAGETCATLPTI
jgi:hypothetical protein